MGTVHPNNPKWKRQRAWFNTPQAELPPLPTDDGEECKAEDLARCLARSASISALSPNSKTGAMSNSAD
jgi:hypothetical protein